MLRSSLPLVFLATSAVAFLACGSDTTTSSTSTGAGGATSTSATTATSTGAGGDTTSGTTATGTASSTSTGAGVMNACTNAADAAIIMSKDVKSITTTCGQQNVGAEPATKDCIKTQTGLSEDCAGCYSGEVDCISEHCIGAEGKCLTAPDAQLCTDCRKMYCVPAYEACSGNKAM